MKNWLIVVSLLLTSVVAHANVPADPEDVNKLVRFGKDSVVDSCLARVVVNIETGEMGYVENGDFCKEFRAKAINESIRALKSSFHSRRRNPNVRSLMGR